MVYRWLRDDFLLDILRRPDQAAPELDAFHDEREGADGRQDVLGCADLEELAPWRKESKVLG